MSKGIRAFLCVSPGLSLLEQDSLALHDGLGCSSSNVAQAQHRSAVADAADEMALGRVVVRLVDVLFAALGEGRRSA